MRRFSVAAIAALVVALSAWRLLAATAGLEVTTATLDGLPVTVMAPVAVGDDAPGIVVAHGFAGSRQLMRSFGVSLARHGYVVGLPDLAGHGANAMPLDREGDVLRDDVLRVRELLVERHRVADTRVVMLGHSMGSGAVMRAGIERPDAVAGVIAVSPIDADVSEQLPRDLQLLAGSLEGRFVANAQDLLARAGGPGGTPGTDGTARRLEIITGVEHVTILFSPRAQATAAGWADRVIGQDPGDFRSVGLIGWWLAALLGVIALWRAVVPSLAPVQGRAAEDGKPSTDIRSDVPDLPETTGVAGRRSVIGAVVGALVATALLAVVGRQVALGGLGGMLVGPALMLWFALAGLAWGWIVTGQPGGAVSRELARPTGRDALGVAVLTIVLTAAFGALAPLAWLAAVPGPSRALYVLPFAVLMLPWTLPMAAGLQDRTGWRTVGWWVTTSTALLLGVGTAAFVVPGIGFVLLLLPLLPPLVGLLVAVLAPWVRRTGQVWGAGVAAALFLGWITAVLFPLS